jgi:hypothetical protein
LLFWPGVALICYHCLGSSAAPVTIALGLFPAVFGLLSTVWKDVAFGASMVLAMALMLHAQIAKSKPALILSLFPMLYALSVRHNSAPGVLAVAIYGAWIHLNVLRSVISWPRTFALGIVVFGLLFAIVTFVNRQLSAGHQTHITQTILLHDLTAISLAEGTIFLPKWVRRDGSTPTLDELRRMYHPGGVVSLFCDHPAINLQQTTDPTDVATLRKAWFATVFRHPGDYLRHRAKVFKSILGIGGPCFSYQNEMSPNPFGIELRPSKANQLVMDLLYALRNSWIFQPWYYLAAIGFMVLIFLRLHSITRIPALFVASSAFLYEASYFLIGPSCDFRLSWLVVLAALVMSVLLSRALLLQRRPVFSTASRNEQPGISGQAAEDSGGVK